MTHANLTRRGALGIAAALPALSLPLQAGAAPQAQPDGPWTGGGDIACAGGSIHYRTLGDAGGEPLVLLHKLGGWIADWRHVAPALAERHRIIAIDLPGHGNSQMHGPAPYLTTVPETAAMVLATLDALGVDTFSVAGNSKGGIIGILLSALWPHKVNSLTLISVSLIDAMSRADLAAQDAERRAAGSKDGVMGMSSFATMDPRVTAEQVAGRARAGEWLRSCERGVGRVGVTDYLPRVAAPTLLLNADRGRYTRHIETGMRLIPDARAEEIADAGSFIHQERPVEVAAAMNRFFSEKSLPRRDSAQR